MADCAAPPDSATDPGPDPGTVTRAIIARMVEGLDLESPMADTSTLESLHFDSLDIVELAMDLEDELGILVDVDEFPRGCTVADVMDLAQRKAAAKVVPIGRAAA